MNGKKIEADNEQEEKKNDEAQCKIKILPKNDVNLKPFSHVCFVRKIIRPKSKLLEGLNFNCSLTIDQLFSMQAMLVGDMRLNIEICTLKEENLAGKILRNLISRFTASK